MEKKLLKDLALQSIILEVGTQDSISYGDVIEGVDNVLSRKFITVSIKPTEELLQMYFNEDTNYHLMQWCIATGTNGDLINICKDVLREGIFEISLTCFEDKEVRINFENRSYFACESDSYILIGDNVNVLVSKILDYSKSKNVQFEISDNYYIILANNRTIKSYDELGLSKNEDENKYIEELKEKVPFNELVKCMIHNNCGIIDLYHKAIRVLSEELYWSVYQSNALNKGSN